MIVTTAICQNQETYYIFREDGVEVAITFVKGFIRGDKDLLPAERKYFERGHHLDLKNQL